MNDEARSILNSALEKARSGRTHQMTREELDAWQEFSRTKATRHEQSVAARIAEARKGFSDRDRSVHAFIELRYKRLDTVNSSDKDEQKIVSEAAAKFRITKDEAERIYRAVDAAGLD